MPSRGRTFIRPHARRPVSRGRYMGGLAVLALLVSAAAAYLNVTNEARLRAYAERWIAGFTGGECRIARARLDWSTGLTLQGVTVATPVSAHFDPRGDYSVDARTVVRASSLFLRLRPLSIITGRLAVPEIVAVDPQLILVRRSSDGLGNWQAMFGRRSGGPAGGLPRLPVVRFRNARVEEYWVDEKGRSGGEGQVIWADAQPIPDKPGVYDLKLSAVTRSGVAGRFAGETTRLQVNMSTLAIAGGLPEMPIREVLFGVPPEANRWIDLLSLRGYVRPDTLSYDGAGGKVTLTLRDASLALPLDDDEQQLPAADRFLRFEEIAGRIQFESGAAVIDLKGKFRGSPMKLAGRMTRDETNGSAGISAVGLDLSVDLADVPLPRADSADSAETRFVTRWQRLANFVRDFDGIGPVDLSLQLRKTAGAASSLEFVQGTMRPKGASARYLRFPYRLHEMTGNVHFRPDGTVGISLVGTHGRGRVSITGWEGGFKTQAGDLRILGQDIALDDDLRRCLDEADQELCRRFGVSARMNLDVHLTRADAPPGTRDNPWRPVIDVTFLDGYASFDKFPYPMTGITGRMRIAGGRFEVQSLTARRSATKVQVSGWVSGAASEHPSMDLKLAAEGLALDETLAKALPASSRATYDLIAPAGLASFSGRIFTKPPSGEFLYDFTADLLNASVSVPGTVARLSNVRSRLHILPGDLVVESLTGRFGASPVTLEGKFVLGPEPASFSLHVLSEKLLLDDQLRAALPARWRAKWADFKPGGAVRLDLTCARAAGAEANASYLARIEPLDAQVTYTGFPFELQKIKGAIELTPAGVQLRELTAEHGPTRLRLSGQITPAEHYARVELSLDAKSLSLDEDLRQAVPWRVRRQWNDIKPTGEMDVKFDRLAFTTGDNGQWQFRGQASFRDMAMRVGPGLSEVTGTLDASGEIGPGLAIEGRLALARGRVDGRLLTEATATLVRRPGESVFKVQDLFGRFYGGTIAGWADVNYGPPKAEYRVALSVRDMSLEQFLSARAEPTQPPVRAQGLVDGSLNLSGQSDDVGSRRGGGNLTIREAQMCKIPMMLKILQVVNLQPDDNAFHDATASFALAGPHVILDEVDLRGKSLSMVGAGSIYTPTETLDLAFLIGGPVRLPRVQLLTELVEGVARELMQVRVEGTLRDPKFRAEVVRSLSSAAETILNARRPASPESRPDPALLRRQLMGR